jgi:hypothetical protein
MATKYWRMTLKGQRSTEEIESAVGRLGGLLLRIHVEGGETRIYFAAAKPTSKRGHPEKDALRVTEVRADEVTRIG